MYQIQEKFQTVIFLNVQPTVNIGGTTMAGPSQCT